MSGINKVILVGNLGKDPEMRSMPSTGNPVANLVLATSLKWTDKQSGEKRENTEWHRVVLFGRLAEIAGQYLSKGSQVYIEGRLQTRKWKDQSGNDRYTTEIVGNDLQMLGGRGDSDDGAAMPPEDNGDFSSDAKPAKPAKETWSKNAGAIADDDVPFASLERGSIV